MASNGEVDAWKMIHAPVVEYMIHLPLKSYDMETVCNEFTHFTQASPFFVILFFEKKGS